MHEDVLLAYGSSSRILLKCHCLQYVLSGKLTKLLVFRINSIQNIIFVMSEIFLWIEAECLFLAMNIEKFKISSSCIDECVLMALKCKEMC